MFAFLGRLVPRLRFVLVVVWLAVAGLALLAPPLSSVSSADETSFLPRDAESLTARQIVGQAFPADAAQASAELVFERKSGLTDADKKAIEDLAPLIQSIPGISRYYSPASKSNPSAMYSGDGQMATAVVNLNVAAYDEAANQAIDEMRTQLHSVLPEGLNAYATGQAGFGRDYLQAINDGTEKTTIVTVALVVIVLLVIYRAPLAAMVPLITIGLAYVVARGTLAFLGQHGLQLSTVIDSFIVVLVFGVGTDYTIFLISRFREELTRAPLREATRQTITRIGAVITASAATVIVGLSAMVVARFAMIQTTGPALALTIFITLLAGLTLTPSLLAILGRWLFWPFHPRTHAEEQVPTGVWARLANGISNHAGLISVVVLLLLAAPVLALPQLKQSFDVPSELPANADSRLGFEAIGDHIGKGQLLRLSVLVKVSNGDLSKPEALNHILTLEQALGRIDNVASVSSVVDPAGTGSAPPGLYPSTQLDAMADSFRKPAGADINTQLGDASLAGVAQAHNYVAGLLEAYPNAESSGVLLSAANDLSVIEQGLVRMRQEALVSNQLDAIGAVLDKAAANPGSSGTTAQLAQLKAYLDELGRAYPDAGARPDYAGAQQAIESLRAGPTAGAYLQLRAAIAGLSKWFAGRPAAAYFAPKSIPATSDLETIAQSVAGARQRLPAELEQVADSFEPNDLYVPPSTGSSGSGTSPSSSGDFRSIYLSGGNDVARLFLTTESDPYSTAAFSTVNEIRAELQRQESLFGPDAQLYLGGPTAEFADIQRTISEDFLAVAGFTIAGILLVLAVLLRSLFAPLYLVATVLLSYLTSLSLSALVLQQGFGQAGINYFIPLMVFVLLVALGSDYNIFLMSRIREEAGIRGLRPGLRVASARTGTVITSAGLILAGTFGALITSPLQLLFQVGVTVALGVLIDTFVVRSLLVPALTTVFGERAWWPSRSAQPASAEAGPPAASDTPGFGARVLAGEQPATDGHASTVSYAGDASNDRWAGANGGSGGRRVAPRRSRSAIGAAIAGIVTAARQERRDGRQ